MSRWMGPARCQSCNARVFWHPEHGWCERPAAEPVKHVCPKGKAA